MDYAIMGKINGEAEFLTTWLDEGKTVEGKSLFPTKQDAEAYIKAFQVVPGMIKNPKTGKLVGVYVAAVEVRVMQVKGAVAIASVTFSCDNCWKCPVNWDCKGAPKPSRQYDADSYGNQDGPDGDGIDDWALLGGD